MISKTKGTEAGASETNEGIPADKVRAFLTEIRDALDVPKAARLDDWDAPGKLANSRASVLVGFLTASIDLPDDRMTMSGLTEIINDICPVTYEALAEDGAA